MQIPNRLLDSLENVKGFNKETFLSVHQSGEQITSIRLNPSKPLVQFPIPIAIGTPSQIPWAELGYYLNERPSFTFDPLFHAGCYYVQEASSMFLEQAVKQSTDLSKSLKILDLCAAPGGKSTHIHSLMTSNSLLVSNEVIRSRANVLKENIIKWGCENVVVTQNDPKDLAKLENYFDVIVVDAPCSGSGLFRRDHMAIEEWSENNVAHCSQRQQRILADIWPALKENGILIYSTCSYSKEEDEEIIKWLLDQFSCESIPLSIDPSWGIIESGNSYRFWPDKVKGEGFFISVIRKKEGAEFRDRQLKKKPLRLDNLDTAIVSNWVNADGKTFIRYEQTIYAWPAEQFNDFAHVLQELRVVYSGVILGELFKGKLVPSPALALSRMVSEKPGRVALEEKDAIRYLQRKELQTEAGEKGWKLVTYKEMPLGWINVLPGRINNYYPKEWRILKDS